MNSRMCDGHPIWRRITETLAIGLLGTLLLSPSHALASSEPEQLIVFLQPGISPVENAFGENHLPEVRKLAEAMGVAVYVVDARKGSPPEATITPLMVYQNYRGRSIYQGRTTTPERIRNFIRTSRYVPQGKEPNRREHIPIWKQGRSRIWAPLKVSAVTGSPPKDYDHATFVENAIQNIGKGFKKFRMQKSADLGRADRGFYMDFYPWLSEDGTLFLTLALFSQFYCHAPVFQKKIIGSWKNRTQLFRQAAAIMEEMVAKIISDPQSGDSFDPVKRSVPQITWAALGFPLPPALQTKTSKATVQAKILKAWILATSGPDDPPMIQFRFPAPLDNYAGVVASGRGELVMSENLQVDGAKGFIEVDTRSSITMGDPVLDEAIRGSVMLYTQKYPIAKFAIDSVSSEGRPIAYGLQTPASVQGTFTLKGKSVPLTAIAEFEPFIAQNGKPRLFVRSAFKIDLRVFNIEGADGPAPAKWILLFDVNFILKAKDETG